MTRYLALLPALCLFPLDPALQAQTEAPAAPATQTTTTPTGVIAAPTDAQIATRASALEVAGAFTNDEFIIRDGHWWGTIAPDAPAVVQVNLFAGNQYWFVAAASPEAKKIDIAIFDEKGRPVHYQPYHNEARTAAGFSPDISGPYYIRISEKEGTPATVCLVYTYK